MGLLATPLESFLTVAAHSSVSAAARQLHVTQPAVTKHVRALEHALGVKLLERTARGVRLTEAGELVRDYGRRSAALLDECQSALLELAAGDIGSLVIGAGVTTSAFHLPRWLSLYRRRWPRIELRVHTGESASVAERVRSREVDCGFVTTLIKHPELHVRPLFTESIVLVVAPDAPYPARAPLESIPMLAFPGGSGFRRYLERAFAAAGLGARVHMEIDSVEAIKNLVAAGLGGAFLPASAVQDELKAGRLRRLTVKGLPSLRRQTYLLRRQDRRPTRALSNLLKLIEA